VSVLLLLRLLLLLGGSLAASAWSSLCLPLLLLLLVVPLLPVEDAGPLCCWSEEVYPADRQGYSMQLMLAACVCMQWLQCTSAMSD
jgi:hypothetical protein